MRVAFLRLLIAAGCHGCLAGKTPTPEQLESFLTGVATNPKLLHCPTEEYEAHLRNWEYCAPQHAAETAAVLARRTVDLHLERIKLAEGVRSGLTTPALSASNDKRVICHEILTKGLLQISKAKLAHIVIGVAEQDVADPVRYAWHFGVLDRMKDEPGVLTFFAKNLDDKRISQANRKPNPGDEVWSNAIRVCDNAEGALKMYLELKKLFEPGDPGYGMTGGESTWEKQDVNIEFLKGVLVKHGIADWSLWKKQPPPVLKKPGPAVLVGDKTAPPSTNWMWGALAIVLVCLSAILIKKLRQRKV